MVHARLFVSKPLHFFKRFFFIFNDVEGCMSVKESERLCV